MTILDKVAKEYLQDPDFSAHDVARKFDSTYKTVKDYKHFLRRAEGDVEGAREIIRERAHIQAAARQARKSAR